MPRPRCHGRATLRLGAALGLLLGVVACSGAPAPRTVPPEADGEDGGSESRGAEPRLGEGGWVTVLEPLPVASAPQEPLPAEPPSPEPPPPPPLPTAPEETTTEARVPEVVKIEPLKAENVELPVPPPVRRATRLLAVEVEEEDRTTLVKLVGDGEFDYTTFHLENPLRFVVDLIDIVKVGPASSLAVDGRVLEEVRAAQFRLEPVPISRVVLDLFRPARPSVQIRADGLLIRVEEEGDR